VNLPALLAQWARIVDDLERTATATPAVSVSERMAQLRRDVAVRHEITTRLVGKPVTRDIREMMAELDEHFRSITVPSTVCTLGDDVAATHGWTPSREWYFWRAPRAEDDA
jgi:hypothetical protein